MRALGFAEKSCLDAERTGGKGASLARLEALGLPVPTGFVVPCYALKSSLGARAEDLRRAIGAASEEAFLAGCAAEAMQIVLGIEIAACTKSDVRARYEALGANSPVAVRSSAACEDSDAASFAGLLETYLNVGGADEVLTRIRESWASFFSERALFYRARKGCLDDLGMAVVVQRMVDAEVAGVMFTVDPVHNRRDRIVIEAALGLGEAVVSGEVTPDHYVLRRDGGLVRETVSEQPFAIESTPEGGTVRRTLVAKEGGRRKLTDDHLAELVRIGCLLQDELGRPQDVEWAIAAGRIHLLQSRPVTT